MEQQRSGHKRTRWGFGRFAVLCGFYVVSVYIKHCSSAFVDGSAVSP